MTASAAPAYVIPRICAEPVELGGYRVAPGSEVWLRVYFMHHDDLIRREPARQLPGVLFEHDTEELHRSRHGRRGEWRKLTSTSAKRSAVYSFVSERRQPGWIGREGD